MHEELQELNNKLTWSIITLPKGKKAINSKWVDRIKYNLNCSIEQYKAWLVAKGYGQTYRMGRNETFALVVMFIIIKCLLAVVTIKDWELHQLDVNNTFINVHLNQKVYMQISQGLLINNG